MSSPFASALCGPAWSLDGSTWHTFLGAYRYGGKPANIEEKNIRLISDSGADFVYNQFIKWTHEITFKFPDDFYSTYAGGPDCYIGGELVDYCDDLEYCPDYGFLDFYNAVGGESGFTGNDGGVGSIPGEFYFSLGGIEASYYDAITVRLAEPGFSPTELKTPASGLMTFNMLETVDDIPLVRVPIQFIVGGRMWEYVLKIKQSVDDQPTNLPPFPYNSYE